MQIEKNKKKHLSYFQSCKTDKNIFNITFLIRTTFQFSCKKIGLKAKII